MLAAKEKGSREPPDFSLFMHLGGGQSLFFFMNTPLPTCRLKEPFKEVIHKMKIFFSFYFLCCGNCDQNPSRKCLTHLKTKLILLMKCHARSLFSNLILNEAPQPLSQASGNEALEGQRDCNSAPPPTPDP